MGDCRNDLREVLRDRDVFCAQGGVMATRFVVTDHAVSRFVERIAPCTRFDEAKALLSTAVLGATPLRDRTNEGQYLWRVEDPAMFFVTKRDDGQDVIVTILSPAQVSRDEQDDADGRAEADEMIAAYLRIRPLIERVKSPQNVPAKAARVLEDLVRYHDTLRHDVRAWSNTRKELRADAFLFAREAAAIRNETPPTKVESPTQTRHAIVNLEVQLKVAQRRFNEQVQRADRMVEDRRRARAALRLLLKAVRALPPVDAEPLLTAVGAIDAHFLTGDFMIGRHITLLTAAAGPAVDEGPILK